MTKKQKEKLIDILSEVYYHKETFGGGYRKILPLIEKLLKVQAEEIREEIKRKNASEIKKANAYIKELEKYKDLQEAEKSEEDGRKMMDSQDIRQEQKKNEDI